MLKEKYSFKMDYNDWVQVCAQLKALQANATVLPHQRTKAKLEQLTILSVLRVLAIRLDKRLCDFKPFLSFPLSQHEALAFLVAFQKGWMKGLEPVREIVNVIDRAV